eukprot:CAMPEP_0195537700 /NCGR_PEP_ID=MMETSP0794_2-20130614/48436_1 /TAXON_ID=515487 /ORGANISM="Stephanopyxis turris, Strain CCMP 815" /LENGTH=82 /DNA_ID=CAMNT_0040671485 /DNA_START=140 /DNA_END=384 /DNA_ORIENTATION=+
MSNSKMPAPLHPDPLKQVATPVGPGARGGSVMNATPRTLGTTSFGSTRGSGLDLTSSKSAPTTAARIKRRLSSRGDLLHSPA